jgi:hypothetical protein
MLNARLNWETRWADIPLKDKALLFEIVSVQLFSMLRKNLPALQGSRTASLFGQIRERLGYRGDREAIHEEQT